MDVEFIKGNRSNMILSDLIVYDDITIQPHDNPDPDALASALGLYKYFEDKGKKVRIVYSGRNQIQKSNLVLMIAECGIDIKYVSPDEFKTDGLLITVDCQAGEGNVTTLNAEHIAVIDHHQGLSEESLAEIRPYLGSCSTLVWDLLKKEGYNVEEDVNLGTAFYYGLMTDTSSFMELSHPLDRDMMDSVKFSKSKIKMFTNSNISLNELEIAGKALQGYKYFENYKTAIIFSEPCDPNILGFINDLALQVDKISSSVVYNDMGFGYKLSVRSCIKEVRANDFVAYITENVGSGGGHNEKAGGYIDKAKLAKEYPKLEIGEFLEMRMKDYYETSEIIYAKDYEIDTTDMSKYQKKRIPLGYVDPSSFLEEGTKVTVRTLEGDFDLEVDGDFYIIIGVKGEVYPIKKDKFVNRYTEEKIPYVFDGQYEPTLHLKAEGTSINLIKYAKTCIFSGKAYIYAKEVDHTVKIFTYWDTDTYMLGKPGDFIACRTDDTKDVYIIEHDIFYKTYEPFDGEE